MQITLNEFHRVEEWAMVANSTSKTITQIIEFYSDAPEFTRKLHTLLFYLVKRQQGLTSFRESFLNALQDHGIPHSQYSLRMLVNVLISNCDGLVRQKLFSLMSQSNPIPLTEFVLGNVCAPPCISTFPL